RRQVWLGEVTVVVRFLLGTLRNCDAALLDPAARLLRDALAAFQSFRLAGDLVLERVLYRAERVQVLDLNLGAQLLLADRPERDVDVAAQLTLFHVRVADAKRAQDRTKFEQVRACLGRRAQVWLR